MIAENGRLPKNPFDAESGEGCAPFDDDVSRAELLGHRRLPRLMQLNIHRNPPGYGYYRIVSKSTQVEAAEHRRSAAFESALACKESALASDYQFEFRGGVPLHRLTLKPPFGKARWP